MPDVVENDGGASAGVTPPAAQGTRAARLSRPARIAVALLVLLGLALRVWILGRAPFNADQAVVGLMAREILHGHFYAFYWGQSYGGGEPYLVALLFAVLGESRLALGLAPLLLDAVAALLVWRIGRRLFDPRAAVLAALLFWLWPEVYVYLSTVEYGFRYLTLVCGLAVFLFALRLAETRLTRLRDWAALGLFAAPAVLWLAYHAIRYRQRPPLVGIAVAAAAAILGAAPWLAANVGHGYPSLRPGAHLYLSAWAGRLGVFGRDVVPLVLGVRLRGSGAWLGGGAVGPAVCLLMAASILAWVTLLALKRRAGLLVLFVVLFPFVYTYAPFSGFWIDGRYAVYLAPVLAMLAASGLWELGRAFPRLARVAPAAGVIAALVLTAGAAARLAPYVPLSHSVGSRSGWTSWSSDPSEWIRPLVVALERSQVGGAYAGYWVAYPLTFEAHGRLVAADPAVNRRPAYLAAVARSPRQAWVFPRASTLGALNAVVGAHPWLPDGSLTLADFEGYLQRHGVAYRSENAGYFTIVYPARPVDMP
jgi:hypothetical protein